MLPSSPQVNEVYLGPAGVLPALLGTRSPAQGFDTLAIDSTTLDVTTAKDVAARLTDGGIRIVDAPVSGGMHPHWSLVTPELTNMLL
jgi:3-hydroxyisobutyrate dehydrogenase